MKRDDIEVIIPKKKHDFKDLIESSFDNVDYVKKQDKLVIEYREKETKLLSEILNELRIIRSKIK